MNSNHDKINNKSKNKCDSSNEPETLGRVKSESKTIGIESNKAIDSDCDGKNQNRKNSNDNRRRRIVGGILSQMIDETTDHLAFSEAQLNYHQSQSNHHQSQIEKLKKRLNNLTELQDKLKNTIDLNNENKD